MNKIFVKKSAFEIKNSFTISDKYKRLLYKVKEKGDLLNKEYYFYDNSNEIQACVIKEVDKKDILYHLKINEEKISTITTNKGFSTKGFTIEPQGIRIQHKNSKLTFTARQEDKLIATISTKLFRLSNTYVIEFSNINGEIMIILMALTIIIDERDPSFFGSVFKTIDWIQP